MIGRALKKLRESENQTLQQVADAVGVSNPYIWKVENGGTPSLTVVQRLAEYFGVPLSALFDDDFRLEDQEAQRFLREFADSLSSEHWAALRAVAHAMLCNSSIHKLSNNDNVSAAQA